MKSDPHSRSLRIGRWLEPGITFAVTTCIHGRRPVLTGECGRLVLAALLHLRESGRARLYGFAIMPDHVHAILQPLGDEVITDLVKSWKAYSARRINPRLGATGALWQPGFFDHALRGSRDFAETLAYIHANPVRLGLVSEPGDYLLSSAHPMWQERIDRLA